MPLCPGCNEPRLMDVEVAPEVGKAVGEDLKTKYMEK